MSDLALHRRSDGNFDLDFDEAVKDLLTSETLENVVVISIGSYARNRGLGNDANLNPIIGGWWGDSLDDKGILGGYLYEAFPGKLTDSTAKKVATLIEESLAWMDEDGIASKVSCESRVDGDNIVVRVNIVTNDGENDFEYSLKWGSADGI